VDSAPQKIWTRNRKDDTTHRNAFGPMAAMLSFRGPNRLIPCSVSIYRILRMRGFNTELKYLPPSH